MVQKCEKRTQYGPICIRQKFVSNCCIKPVFCVKRKVPSWSKKLKCFITGKNLDHQKYVWKDFKTGQMWARVFGVSVEISSLIFQKMHTKERTVFLTFWVVKHERLHWNYWRWNYCSLYKSYKKHWTSREEKQHPRLHTEIPDAETTVVCTNLIET